jgi:hypothetical protein
MSYDPATRRHYLGDDEIQAMSMKINRNKRLDRSIVYALLACMENDSTLSEGGTILDHAMLLDLVEQIPHDRLEVCWCSKCKGDKP